MVRHLKHRGTIYLPILLLVIMLGLLTFHHAIKERNLTPEGMSRNIVVMEGAKGKILAASKAESGYDLHYNENDKLTYLHVNEKLEVTDKEVLPIEIGLSSSFWAKENNVIYLRKGEIHYYDGSKSTTLDDEVDGLSAAEQSIVYWKKNRIYSIDPKTQETKEIAQTDLPIQNLFTSDDTDGLFAAIVPKEDISSDVIVFRTSGGSTEEKYRFNVPSLSGEQIDTVDLSESTEGTHLIYTTTQRRGGTVTTRGYYTLLTNENTPEFQQIKVYDSFTNQRVRKIDELNLMLTDTGPKVTLSARGMITPKKSSWNVYRTAPNGQGKWIADHISSSTSVSNNHVMVSPNDIFWLDIEGSNKIIMAANDHPELVQKAEHLQPSDFVQGFYKGISTLPYGFILLMVGFLWVAPSIIFLFCTSFWNEDAIEQKKTWVRYIAIGLFGICQLYLMQQFFTPMFERFSPEYLSFPWHSILLPVAFILLSMLFTRMVRHKHWNMYQEFGYFALFNTLFVMFLISPYVV